MRSALSFSRFCEYFLAAPSTWSLLELHEQLLTYDLRPSSTAVALDETQEKNAI